MQAQIRTHALGALGLIPFWASETHTWECGSSGPTRPSSCWCFRHRKGTNRFNKLHAICVDWTVQIKNLHLSLSWLYFWFLTSRWFVWVHHSQRLCQKDYLSFLFHLFGCWYEFSYCRELGRRIEKISMTTEMVDPEAFGSRVPSSIANIFFLRISFILVCTSWINYFFSDEINIL
jgi:hypothetical protein